MAEIVGTERSEILEGTNESDEIFGLTGDDRLKGLLGDDRYFITENSGSDRIQTETGGDDRIVIDDPTVTADDIRLQAVGIDDSLRVSIEGSSRSILIEDHFDDSRRVEAIEFADGTLLSLEPSDGLTFGPFAQGERVRGTPFDDTLIGGAGNDLLGGGDGDDRYIIGFNSGSDTINSFEADTSGNDTLVIDDSTVDENDILLRRDSDDLVISINDGSGRTVKVDDHFNFDGGVIEQIEFADGRQLTLDPADGLTFGPFIGEDTLIGTNFADTLIGGPANDELGGGLGDDTYVIDVGSGRDTINLRRVAENGGDDKIKIVDPSVQKSDIVFLTGSNSLQVIFDDGSNRSVLVNQQFGVGGGLIETIEFADGSMLSLDPFDGLTFGGLRGSDTVLGTSFDDILVGGLGNDNLVGGQGNDTYIFEPGFGVDTITDSEGVSTIVFYDLVPEDLTISGTGQVQASIRVNGEADQLTLRTGSVNSTPPPELVFVSSQDDVLTGSAENDVLVGGAGNDRYTVNDAGDRIIERPGEGFDRIDVAVDLPNFQTPENVELVVLLNGVTTATPATSGTRLVGIDDGNVFFSGAGNDEYDGNAGIDTLSYERAGEGVSASLLKPTAFNTGGAGTDKIDDIENLTGSAFDDVLVGAQGISNIIDGGDGDDLIVGFAGPDTLIGGEGADIFAYNRLDFRDSLINGGEDLIIDFDGDEDMLDLSRLGVTADAITIVPGRIEVDVNDNDGVPEFAIDFANNAVVAVEDIIV